MKVQLDLMSQISSKFSKCKYLQPEYAEKIVRDNKNDANAKKVNQDQEMIDQIMAMGF